MGRKLVKKEETTKKNNNLYLILITVFSCMILLMIIGYTILKSSVVYVDATVYDLHSHGGSDGHGYVKYEYNGVEYKDIDMEILTSVTDRDTIQIPIKKDNPEVLGNIDLLITADIVFWIVTAILLIPLGFSIRNFVDRKEQKG